MKPGLSILAGATYLAALVSGAHAQSARGQPSPFGVAMLRQKRHAVQSEAAQLNALAAWTNLPSKMQQSLIAEMATMPRPIVRRCSRPFHP